MSKRKTKSRKSSSKPRGRRRSMRRFADIVSERLLQDIAVDAANKNCEKAIRSYWKSGGLATDAKTRALYEGAKNAIDMHCGGEVVKEKMRFIEEDLPYIPDPEPRNVRIDPGAIHGRKSDLLMNLRDQLFREGYFEREGGISVTQDIIPEHGLEEDDLDESAVIAEGGMTVRNYGPDKRVGSAKAESFFHVMQGGKRKSVRLTPQNVAKAADAGLITNMEGRNLLERWVKLDRAQAALARREISTPHIDPLPTLIEYGVREQEVERVPTDKSAPGYVGRGRYTESGDYLVTDISTSTGRRRQLLQPKGGGPALIREWNTAAGKWRQPRPVKLSRPVKLK